MNEGKRFVIVNDCDAPIRKHVAQWVDGVGYCYMSRASLPYLKKFDGMKPRNPTPIENFGFAVSVAGTAATFVPTGQTTAVYEDGVPRRWHECNTEQFTLPLVTNLRKHVRKS